MENNVWRMTTFSVLACVDALDDIGNNPLTDVWRDVGNDTYDFRLQLLNGTRFFSVHLRLHITLRKKVTRGKVTRLGNISSILSTVSRDVLHDPNEIIDFEYKYFEGKPITSWLVCDNNVLHWLFLDHSWIFSSQNPAVLFINKSI